jgi:hypothetical protein
MKAPDIDYRIGNRSDALTIFDQVIEEVDDLAGSANSTGEISQWAFTIGIALAELRSAIEREVI